METQKQRRNRLARERYTQNERTRERYQLKARAAISERNEKRKVVRREKAKEDGYIFCGSKKYGPVWVDGWMDGWVGGWLVEPG